jgi:TrmH family RNA methyltransferase
VPDLLPPSRHQITDWAKLAQKKFRREFRQFLIEGEVCVREAIRSRAKLQAVLILASNEELAEEVPRSVPCYSLGTEAFQRISKVESNQGIVAVGNIFDLPAREGKISIACEQVSDPGNCGALIRVADFFGASELYLGKESAEIWNQKVVRGSMGSLFHQPIQEQSDLLNLISTWKGSTVALVAHGGKSLRTKPRLKPPVLLVLGHETRGLSPEISDLCSDKLTLEPTGQAESLNLVTAAAVFAYVLTP